MRLFVFDDPFYPMKIKFLSQMLDFGLLCGIRLLIIEFILGNNFVPALDLLYG